ncbi:unnamed protein product [Prorocentrum cordatum]|uniref:Uncharacterized protein n=1 Tax=Prorocentrum cordatum TaxID=2364126 RepID=A0ABN9WK73_9DINO|nr:unnamed protein product [Polarella glacialis]
MPPPKLKKVDRDKKGQSSVPEAPKEAPRSSGRPAASPATSSQVAVQLPMVRVYAVLREALINNDHKVCIGAEHLGWSMAEGAQHLSPAGLALMEGHLFFIVRACAAQ